MNVRSNYKELLQRPEWKSKRDEIRNRDKVCKWCGSNKRLEVHHIVYLKDRMPWEYSNYFFVLLCHECHKEESYYSFKLKELINNKKLSGLKSEQIINYIQPEIKQECIDRISDDTGYYDEIMEHIDFDYLWKSVLQHNKKLAINNSIS